METQKVAEVLVSLCRQGRFIDALTALYGDDVVSVGSPSPSAGDGETHGLDVVRAKNLRWLEDNVVHEVVADSPLVKDDRFCVIYQFDVTPRVGPRAGVRTKTREVALYTTRSGRIVREEFFH